MKILTIKNLFIKYEENYAVKNLNLDLYKGESIGIIGESGSGKSSIALAIMGLLKDKASLKGNINYRNEKLTDLSEKKWRKYRFRKIALIFQNSLEVLNPIMTLEAQIYEVIYDLDKDEKLKELFNSVGLEYKYKDSYPHEISGGMRQKFLIAMALACNPEVLIADEPTTALDYISKQEILILIKKLQKIYGFSLIVISHDMNVIQELTSRILVMYQGYVLETGITDEVMTSPSHPYSRGLINSTPEVNPYKDLWGIHGEVENESLKGCPFFQRCTQKKSECMNYAPQLKKILNTREIACLRGGIITLLKGKNIYKTYTSKKLTTNACTNCSIELSSGEIAVILGQSGSGKTTLAEILCGITKPDEGTIHFDNQDIKSKNFSSVLGGMQIIFQDPLSSLNANFSIEKTINEPLYINKIGSKEENRDKIRKILKNIQLPNDQNFMKRKIHTLSGGQRQRIAIARALIMEPKVLIADEISSMLDPSTKANILRLLKNLQNKEGFSMFYITHDVPLAKKIADKIYVMKDGKIIENGDSKTIFFNAQNEFTKKLLG